MSRVIDFLIILLIFAIVVLGFYFINQQEAIFNLFGKQHATSLGYLTGGFGLFGFILGTFFTASSAFRGRKNKSDHNKKVYDLERQLEGMKMSLETLSSTLLNTPSPESTKAIDIIEDTLKDDFKN